jgi:DNA-binding phage protein
MKARPSKLDQYAEQLQALQDENKTLAQIQEWLKGEGVTVSIGRLSEFLQQQRQARLQSRLLDKIASGAQQAREVEKQFGDNPPPELDTLIKLHRVLILQLSTQAQADPRLITLVNNSMRTVMEWLSGRTKAELEKEKLGLQERRVKLLEQKAEAFDRVKQAVNSGGITPETLTKIEQELRLL